MANAKVCLYARVSTAHQGTGLEAQIRALNEYCRLNNIENTELFTDENQSGTKQSRPGLDRMMAAVENGEVNCVVVYSFSRFARSVTHLLAALEVFKRKNVGFVSLTEKIDTSTPIGKAIFVIISAISQLERDLIAERVKNGLANARAKGVHIGRKKTRPSELIRALLKQNMPFRQISKICGCSHGSISLEKRSWEKEKRETESKIATQAVAVFPTLQQPLSQTT